MSLNAEPQSPVLEVKAVETLREYVRGFPVYVAMTIASGPGSSFSGLRFANLIDLAGCIGIELKKDGKTVLNSLPVPRLLDNPERQDGELRQGESRRMLTDISQLIPPEISEGSYTARVIYGAERDEYYWSKPFDIKFRNPTKTEIEWLDTLAPDRRDALEWTDWTITQPKYTVYVGRIAPENPLKLNLVLRRLFFGPEPLEQVNPDMLDVLTAGNDSRLFEPETRALKAELYQAQHNGQKFQQAMAEIHARTSGLDWWTRMLEKGGGFLTTFRMGPAPNR